MINIIVALPAEAKALIDTLKLKRVHSVKFLTLYENPPYRLVVSGTGKTAAAASVGFLQGLDNTQQAWLNIGIAGDADLQVGTAVLIYKICDHETQSCWYPQVLFQHEMQAGMLTSINRASDDYIKDNLIDMEASAIAEIVARVSCMELFQCIKIISDNRQNHYSTVDKQLVYELIAQNLAHIQHVMQELIAKLNLITALDRPPELYRQLVNKWHFTTTQKNHLFKDLKQLEFKHASSTLAQQLDKCNDVKMVFETIQTFLQNG